MNPENPQKPTNLIHPKKLLLSKWTAVKPVGKAKHFLVAKVIAAELPGGPIEWVELESVLSKKSTRIAWRELKDGALWRQGWVWLLAPIWRWPIISSLRAAFPLCSASCWPKIRYRNGCSFSRAGPCWTSWNSGR
jgi:tryptophan-rich hypothetical protein